MKSELQAALADSETRCTTMESDSALLSDRLCLLESELSTAAGERSALQEHLAASKAEAAQLSSAIAAKAAELEALRDEVAAKRAESAAKVNMERASEHQYGWLGQGWHWQPAAPVLACTMHGSKMMPPAACEGNKKKLGSQASSTVRCPAGQGD